MAVKPKLSIRKKKKHWYPILASIEFNNMEIGECPLDDPQLLKNRKISVNLMNLTKEHKKQNTRIIFKINEIKENKGMTQMTGYETLSSHIKRISKRAKSKIEDSFIFETKDNKKVKIKPLITSKNTASRAVRTSLRLKSREIVTNFGKKRTYKEFLKTLLSTGLQIDLKKGLKKILPVSTILIKSASIIEPKK